MAVKTGSGTKLYISTTVPASTVDTAAEFDALTYTKLGLLSSLGDFGDEAAVVQFVDMETSRVQKLAGPKDAGSLQAQCGYDALDAGQAAFADACDDGFEYAFKIEVADKQSDLYTNSLYFFKGVVRSKRISNADPNGVRTRSFQVEINSQIYEILTELISP